MIPPDPDRIACEVALGLAGGTLLGGAITTTWQVLQALGALPA